MSSEVWWYADRSAGLVAWALLLASILWGLALSTRAVEHRPAPLLDLHRFLGGLAVIFTVVHIVAVMANGFVQFGVVDVLVPLASGWRPVAIAWGIVAFYLLLAVELTSLARAKLPEPVWRRIHYGSFPLGVFATIHGLASGPDVAGPVAATAVLAVTGTVVGLAVVRRAQGRRWDAGARPPLSPSRRVSTTPVPPGRAPIITVPKGRRPRR